MSKGPHEDTIKHGVNGWGLEIFSRDEDEKGNVWGTYLYEHERTREQRQVVRLLERSTA